VSKVSLNLSIVKNIKENFKRLAKKERKKKKELIA